MLPDDYKLTNLTRAKLDKLHLHNEWDLLLHLPLRYEDETHLTPIADIRVGMTCLIEGKVIHCEIRTQLRKQLIAQIQDKSGGIINLRFLHFYGNLSKQLTVGSQIRALGEVKMGYHNQEMIHPKLKTADNQVLAEHLTPIYPTTQGLNQPTLRRIITHALSKIDLRDSLPDELLRSLRLPSLADSLRLLHNPPPHISIQDLSDKNSAPWRRLKFDELLAQQLSMLLVRQTRKQGNAQALHGTGQLTNALVAQLPFTLTQAQQRVWHEICADLAQNHPMHRLLQGDVGSGKTIVAALSALTALESDESIQVALMAPTEILAEQHYVKFQQWLEPLGIRVAWLSGSLKKREKEQTKTALSNGQIRIAIGTHALFQNDVSFANLGLVLVDEQHRFGVEQRLALKNKGLDVHQLMMSATPIPRTLAMSFYADLDVSVIDELPPNRTPIQTRLVNSMRRDQVEGFVLNICQTGQQVYWVCPLIEESETLQLQTATETLAQLRLALPQLNIGLIHGRMKPAEKAAVMTQFIANTIQILVATTVIEVGVDVPNASVMVIENPERLGLAQLHQLRGRVGRGSIASQCILLFSEPLGNLAKAKLKVIFENTDGFEIARQDLLLRGPGEFLGARQSGAAMLRFADLNHDIDLLEMARNLAPYLIEQHMDIVQQHLQRWFSSRQAYWVA